MASLLAIESSTPRASLVLWRDGEVVFEGGFESDRHHNALLFAPLRQAIEILGESRLDEVIVGTGPGSYSGTRVGIAAGQGVGLVHDCPVVGLSSLLALGFAEGTVVGDARRGSGWWAEIGDGLPDPQLAEAAELPGLVPGEVFALEDLGKLGLPPEIEVRPAQPTARRLVEAWLALDEPTRAPLRAEPPQPAYLRPPHITEAKKGHPLLRK
ncbi:tRNA threonylcarbamoyl adenosine modification protein YeaZ [Haloferula helveola]|uniref:tRNA threonylcarbamoyl adenosine modification protein YeaZ n=1 Tax=Haloferula helveola TaxID=490095 RepID=A0ABM7RE72_9BACT|nr:tRNA threonylcarbamoyl adenosine modification protein YeaZ [Haloferula helveola]